MANQTISVNRNLDDAAIAGLLNGEDITINTAARLTINSDNRWSQQAAVIGNVTIDSNTGGACEINGTEVWWIPFDGGVGLVPALGALGAADVVGAIAGVGEFLGVFTALGVAPTAAAAAMPATGFIKLRRFTVAFVDNEVITLTGGAAVTVNSATGGQRGWIHVCGEEASTINIPRVGTFEALGDWFELGLTNGADDQTFRYYVEDQCPALQIETGSGTGVYEWWVCAGTTRWAQANLRVATDARGKLFGCTTVGLITIATRVGNDCGFKPPAGCRVRVPNIHLCSAAVANWALNLRNATLATRWDFTTTSAGDMEFDKVNLNAYPAFSQPYRVVITDCGVLDQVSIVECATEPILTRVAVGLSSNLDNTPINVASCFAGVSMINCTAVKYESEGGDQGSSVIDCDDVTITGGVYMTFGDNTAATIARGAGSTGALALARVTNSVLTDVSVIGASIRLVSCVAVTVNNPIFAHLLEGQDTTAVNPVSAVDISGASSGCVVNGYGGNFAGLANVHPYNAIVAIAASFNNQVLNIGTPAAPYDCGSANACAGVVAYGGNTSGNLVRRCYTVNARNGGITDTNADARNTAWDVWGDGADVFFVLNGLNTEARGLRSTNPTTGETAVYGTHFYDTFVSTTEGRMIFAANEPTALSGSKLAVTAGVAQFTSTGRVKLVTIGDEVTWEMDYFWLGITALSNVAPTFSGTNSANHVIEFQHDTGSGYNGVWLTATGANLSGVGAIVPTTGIKLKLRVRCVTAASTNAVINVRITATTNATDYQTQRPIGVDVTYSLTGLDVGTEVVLFDSTDTEVDRQVLAGSTYAYDYFWETNTTGWYALIWKDDRVPIKFTVGTLTNTNVSIPVSQSDDLVYDGTLVGTDTTIDAALSLQIMDSGVTAITVSRIYSEWKDWLRLTNNAQYDFAYSIVGGDTISGPKSIPFYIFQANGWKLRPQEASATLAVSGGVVVGESGGDPFVNTLGAHTVRINYEQPVQAIVVSTGGTVAPTASEMRTALGLSAANLDTQIDALPTAVEIRVEMDSNSTELDSIKNLTGLIPGLF